MALTTSEGGTARCKQQVCRCRGLRRCGAGLVPVAKKFHTCAVGELCVKGIEMRQGSMNESGQCSGVGQRWHAGVLRT